MVTFTTYSECDTPLPSGNGYRLIPNGKSVSFNHPSEGLSVNHYLVECRETGECMPWRGKAISKYIDDEDYEYWYEDLGFEDFLELSDSRRKSWKSLELEMLKALPNYNADLNILEKERTMNCYSNAAVATVAAVQPETVDQRKYLMRRLSDAQWIKQTKLHDFFKLNPVRGPTTLKGLVDAIKSGDYSFDEKLDENTDMYSVGSVVDSVRWTKDKPDRKGYDAAIKSMKDEVSAVTDTITILSPEEGLKALQAFETQTFH